jgi:subtilisin family serine protease/5-hydroxyisourate hydrolase-like protein (transthyretin family)
MKIKLIIISVILLLVMVFASGCIPIMEKLGLVNPVNEEQLSPEKGGPPDGLVKVLIGFKEKPGAAQQVMVRGVGGKIKYTYNLIPAIAASVPEVAIEALKKNPNITNVELDSMVYALDTELDNSWGVKRIGAGFVHDSGNKGAGVNVAIIDTGIDYTHSDLNANYVGGYDFVNGDDDPMDDDTAYGHGTHVAGIVAAEDNGEGVVGVAPEASLYALKALNSEGVGYVSDVVLAIQWATDPNGNGYAEDRLDIINMSLGGRKNIFLEWACNLAYLDGLLLVAAAGNGGAVIYPAAYSSVVAVSATDEEDNLAYFSSTGSQVEFAAPGNNIYSTYLNNGYKTLSGTSMSSPHVAGTAALVWAANGCSNDAVRTQLQSTAEDIGLSTREQGYGLVDAAEAAGVGTPPPDTGTIAGKVTDNTDSSLAIAGAKVAVEGTSLSAITNTEGNYIIDDVPEGTYTITASAMGYIEESLPVEVLQGQMTVVNFVLTPTSVVTTLCVNVVTDNASYKLRETVYITVTVTEDNESGQPVEGAIVQIEITTASGRKYTKDGVTDSDGKITFKFKIKRPDGTGTYNVIANAFKSGYESGSGATSFNVN